MAEAANLAKRWTSRPAQPVDPPMLDNDDDFYDASDDNGDYAEEVTDEKQQYQEEIIRGGVGEEEGNLYISNYNTAVLAAINAIDLSNCSRTTCRLRVTRH